MFKKLSYILLGIQVAVLILRIFVTFSWWLVPIPLIIFLGLLGYAYILWRFFPLLFIPITAFTPTYNAEILKDGREYAVPIIKNFEGLNLESYDDGSRRSIGYGTHAKGRNTITIEQAEAEFQSYLDFVYQQVGFANNLRFQRPLVYTCLCDFAYNVGRIPKELKTAIQSEDYLAASAIFSANGKGVKHVENRRAFCNEVFKSYL